MKKKLPAYKPQELIDDIRSSLADADLMEKYGLTADQYSQAVKRLYLKGLITRSELKDRIGKPFTDDEVADLAVDLRLGLFYDEIKEKYDLSQIDLEKALRVIAAQGLAPEDDTRSAVKAVNPREAVQDLLAHGSQERLKHKYGLSDEDLGRLFISLVDRSFISADEFTEWHGVAPPFAEPPRVMVYEATDEFQTSLVEALLAEADISFFSRLKRPGTPSSLTDSGERVQFFVKKAEANEARRRLYELQRVEPRFIGEIRCEECDFAGLDPSEFEFFGEKDSSEDKHDDDAGAGPNYLVQIVGLVALAVLVAYVFGWIKF